MRTPRTHATPAEGKTLTLFSSNATGPLSASDETLPKPLGRPRPEPRRFTPVFSVRLVKERALDTPIVTSPDDVARVFSEYLDGLDREHVAVALLSARGQLIGLHTCHVGALTACTVSVRDVFKVALLANAASFVMAHNHPSGNLEPSRADIEITKKLAEAGRLMEVQLLDHIIVGFDGNYTSLAARGLLG